MKGIRIYCEGGGNSKSGKQRLSPGFRSFFGALRGMARIHNLKWDFILCGSREQTFRDFRNAIRRHPDSFNILLVDSEGAVHESPWAHLQARDNWKNPGVAADRCHLMVQTVEAWFVADPEALERYYGQNFQRSAIPPTGDVESIGKSDLYDALEQATRRTQKGPYRKIQHCAALLKSINPEKVRSRARHCDRLFKTIEETIGSISP